MPKICGSMIGIKVSLIFEIPSCVTKVLNPFAFVKTDFGSDVNLQLRLDSLRVQKEQIERKVFFGCSCK